MSDEDLTLTSGGPPSKRRRKPPAPSVRLESLFKKEFAKQWGFPPIINQARDRKLFNKLIEQWDETTVAELIPVFFSTTDPDVKRCRFYNVPDFFYWAPKLRMRRSSVPRRTASNINEISKAMGHEKK